jgi:hypothetical protein
LLALEEPLDGLIAEVPLQQGSQRRAENTWRRHGCSG